MKLALFICITLMAASQSVFAGHSGIFCQWGFDLLCLSEDASSARPITLQDLYGLGSSTITIHTNLPALEKRLADQNRLGRILNLASRV